MPRLFWLGPLVLLQACAGTPVAERLERSFAAPQSEMSSSSGISSPPTKTSPAAAAPESSVAGDAPEERAATKKETTKKDTTKKKITKDDTPKKDSAPTSPAISEPSTSAVSEVSAEEAEPYRITIRLSGADPSAPAEAVTRALRNADVRFAVERIERIQP